MNVDVDGVGVPVESWIAEICLLHAGAGLGILRLRLGIEAAVAVEPAKLACSRKFSPRATYLTGNSRVRKDCRTVWEEVVFHWRFYRMVLTVTVLPLYEQFATRPK